jgi:hypothetical protein
MVDLDVPTRTEAWVGFHCGRTAIEVSVFPPGSAIEPLRRPGRIIHRKLIGDVTLGGPKPQV